MYIKCILNFDGYVSLGNVAFYSKANLSASASLPWQMIETETRNAQKKFQTNHNKKCIYTTPDYLGSSRNKMLRGDASMYLYFNMNKCFYQLWDNQSGNLIIGDRLDVISDDADGNNETIKIFIINAMQLVMHNCIHYILVKIFYV